VSIGPADLPTLRTDRLVLAPYTVGAGRAVLAGGDPGVRLGAGYPHAETVDRLRLLTEHAPVDSPADDRLVGWFVILAEEGVVIGDCGAKTEPDEQGRVEVGYGLSASYRRHGYGSEAVAALVSWLGTQPGVRAVTAEVDVGNVASRRLLERLGFDLESTSGNTWALVLRLGSRP